MKVARGSIVELGPARRTDLAVQDCSTMQSEDSRHHPPQSRREAGAADGAAASSSNQQQPAPSAAVAAPHGAKVVLQNASDGDVTPNENRCDHKNPGQTSLYFGNWGIRAANPKNPDKHTPKDDVHANNVAQILKSPCHIVTLAEANDATRTDLQSGTAPQSRRETRFQFDQRHQQDDGHYAFRGPDENDVLVAVRRSVASDLLLLQSNCNVSNAKGQTKVMMCEIAFKRDVERIGASLGVAVVHLHYDLAKKGIESPVYKQFWNSLATDLTRNGIRFMSGDFNMALPRVLLELRSRGVLADLCAWYPYWNKMGLEKFNMDSCAIFVIGGNAHAEPKWTEEDIHVFSSPQTASTQLPTFDGPHPGQSWVSYTPKTKSVGELLGPMLQRSFQKPDATTTHRAFLRVKQKELNRYIWELDGVVHGGAHFPLAIYTVGASYRSAESAQKRSSKRNGRSSRAEVSALELATAEGGLLLSPPSYAVAADDMMHEGMMPAAGPTRSAAAVAADDVMQWLESFQYPTLQGCVERYDGNTYA